MEETQTVELVPMDRLAKVYVKIRDKISEMTREYESQVEVLKEQQAQIAATMKDQLRATNALSTKTEHGTVSLITKKRYVAMDQDAFKAFVIEHQAVDLYEQRIAQKNMAEFIEKNPDVSIAGLNVLSEVTVSVRRPTK
jgi:hypothetical protein